MKLKELEGPIPSQRGLLVGGYKMAKIVECAKVDPSSGCTHIMRGETEEELFKNAAEHAKEHGIKEVTPELMMKLKAAIREE